MSTAIAKQSPITITPEMQAMIDAKVAEALANRPKGYNLSLKISNKGAVSIYGMGRFPVTLYPEQIVALAQFMPTVLKFVDTNAEAIKARQANPIIVEPKV